MDQPSRFGGLSESITAFFSRKKSVAASPPRLHSPRFLGQTQFEFKIQMAKGQTYELQSSRDLKNWKSVTLDTAPSENFEYLDSEAGKTNAQFYRVWSGPLSSVNVIGYVTATVPPGFCMISNPLNGADNRVEIIFAGVPEGTTFNKFDTMLFRLTKNGFENGKWLNPNETLAPGEGALLSNPTSDFRQIHFIGDVQQGELSLPIPPGFSIRSSQLPLSGAIDSDLGFPIAEGDVIHLFDRDQQKYIIHTFENGRWSPSPPLILAGEAFWVGKTSPSNWAQTFISKPAGADSKEP